MIEAPANGRKKDKGMWLGGEPVWHKEWRMREGSALERAVANAEVFIWRAANNGFRVSAGLPEISPELVGERIQRLTRVNGWRH